jgi:PAT family beta-lactamase induction signal transducer AmpG
LLLLAMCRQTLEYTQRTDSFLPRVHFAGSYRWALRLLLTGSLLLALWVVMLITDGLDWTHLATLAGKTVQLGALLCLLGIVLGSVLDFLALRRQEKI